MRNLFLPDYILNKYSDVTPEFLFALGIRALIIDIDNTLVPYDQPDAPEDVLSWFDVLRRAEISAALVSNNHAERVEKFNSTLGLPSYPDSSKPHRRALLEAMKEMGSSPRDTAVVGDQLLTDVLAGKRLGLMAVYILPIKDKRTLFYRTKRLIERPFIRLYYRKQRKREAEREDE